ncbi:hypothetical protein BT67DRAFT_172804 [Trichocladium antarcticum]|uniref:Secreted protein n=1 Tax=Trichocladium antarcticum TaxID=1450529 RepID=A0AAN6UDY8_9PEZI|nr:hypothetical protein BT67DRAFT_172804 [Trichocladium antarcticum]
MGKIAPGSGINPCLFLIRLATALPLLASAAAKPKEPGHAALSRRWCKLPPRHQDQPLACVPPSTAFLFRFSIDWVCRSKCDATSSSRPFVLTPSLLKQLALSPFIPVASPLFL